MAAYPNATINEGSYGSFLASATIALYQRLKFVTGSSADGKASLAVCAIGDRTEAIAMQPIASGSYGTVRFINAPGEQFGIASGTIALGALVYTAAAGVFSTTSTGGALLAGKATSAAIDTLPFTFLPVSAAA